jgi:hypothetical protein
MDVLIETAIAIGVVVGLLVMFFGLRKAEQKIVVFDNIDGALKEDWTRTGQIDFHVSDPDNASPQSMILRVEERKLIENVIGQEVAQLRWRLATLEEAKDIVVCWNRARSADQRGVARPGVIGLARAAT